MKSKTLIYFTLIGLFLIMIAIFSSSFVRISIYDFSNRKLIESGFVASDININKIEFADKSRIIKLIERTTLATNILFLNITDLEQQILALDWVKGVTIKSNLSNGLNINIIEHQPRAFYQTKSDFRIIDKAAEVILVLDEIGSLRSILPQLVGEGALINAKEIIPILMLSFDFYKKIMIIERIGLRRWDLTLYDGVIIKLPENEVRENWKYFLNFEEEFNILNSEIKSIDLRTKDRLFIEFNKDLKDIKFLQ
ncbi:MAG: FtsQ-type POTRA domain-containing protein [Rickettsiales bacterium]|jgi:cell division protein FtsQ|nr:FtsQ-type POTRA domain-containing protein [Rickettsiales bacterium]